MAGRTTPMAQGAASHPIWGGSATPQFFIFFFIDLTGWLGHPLWGGSATPLFFFFHRLFFFILIYFIFKIKFLKNNILLVKNGAF
jgi:hypothetical protein